jgi:two-component system, sensor histidine kinase and response regulator
MTRPREGQSRPPDAGDLRGNAEKALRQSEERIAWLAKFPADNPSPVIRIGADGVILYSNKAAAPLLETWGCREGEILRDPWLRLALDSLGSGSTQQIEGECGDRVFAMALAPVVNAGYVNLYAFDITDRKKAEETLRVNEELYRTLIETTGTGYVIVDSEGRVVDANSEYARLAARGGAAELRGRSVLEWTADYHLAKNAEAVRQCATEGYIRNLEIDYIDARGKVTPIEVNATVIETDGTPRILTLCRDITERKRAEDKLAAERALAQRYLDIAGVILLVLDADGNITLLNRRGYEVLEYPEGELLGRNWLETCLPERERSRILSVIRQLAAGDVQPVEHIENPVLTRSGMERVVAWHNTAMFDEQGGFVGTLSSGEDITERRQAEESLRRSEELYRSLVDNLLAGVTLIDPSHTIIATNPAQVQMFGKTSADFVGKKCYHEFEKRDAVCPHCPGVKAMTTGQAAEVETEGVKDDGSRFAARVKALPWRGPDGAVMGFIELVEDLTDRKKAEEEIRFKTALLEAQSETSLDGILLVDTEGRARPLNKRLGEMLSIPPETLDMQSDDALIQCALRQVRDPAAFLAATAHLNDHPEAKSSDRFEFKDGRVFDRYSSPLRGPKGVYYGRIWYFRDVTERTRAEETLRESEEWYRTLFVEARDGICLVDAKTGLIIDCNQALAALVGRDKADLIGQPQTLLHPPAEDNGPFSPTFKQHLGDRAGEILDTQVVTRTGEIKEVSIRARTLVLAGKTVMQGLFRDITDRARAEEALQKSEAKFRGIAERSFDAIFTTDLQGEITYISPTAEKVFGAKPEEMVGRHFTTFIAKEEIRRALRRFSKTMACGGSETGEWKVARKDGSRASIEISVSAVREHGKVVGSQGIVRDVTDRKRAEESLRRSHEELQAMYDGMSDGLLIADVDAARFVRANRSICRMLGYPESELLSLSVRDIHPADEMDSVLASFNALARGEKSVAEGIPVLRKSGAVFFADISASAIVYGGRNCLMGFFRDVTERRQHESELATAKEAAEAANRAKSEFLANMSHEIRTPMTAILGFADLLTMPDLSAQEQRQYSDAIQRNGKALLELINDILDLSRIEAEKLTLEQADCPLVQVVEDVLSVCRVRAQEKGLTLEADYRLPLPEKIRTDPTRLRQILVNLVGNAVKFTQRGGVTVRVELKDEGGGMRDEGEDEGGRMKDEVGTVPGDDDKKDIHPSSLIPHPSSLILRFSVSDTGIGIPADKLGQIFQPFVQADASLTRRYGGSGLGLAISMRLAKALGGEIEVASELGKGSTFTF